MNGKRPLPALFSFVFAALGLVLVACPAPEEPPPEGTPRLVLFLTVDQFRGDYLERVRPLLAGGLPRLADESVVFTETHHRHAATSTGPGHATLATGAHPSVHGIIGNVWYDRELEEYVYCVGDPQHGSSPHRLLAPTLGDRLKERYRSAKVWSASGKDRAAILSGGLHPDGALWYDRETGDFTTSSYYDAPEWLEDWNDRRLADRWFGTLWEPLPQTSAGAGVVDLVDVDRGAFAWEFPHVLGSVALLPDEAYYRALYDSPFVDELLLELAATLIVEEGLGGDEVPDLLALSFSAMDTVGHDFGPDSLEWLDTMLRLDRILGELLDVVDREVGLEHVAISFSSDHGVAPLPEAQQARGLPGRRISAPEVACFQRAGRDLAQRYGTGDWVRDDGYLFPGEAEGEPSRQELERAVVGRLAACPGIEKVWTRSELAGAPVSADPMHRLFAHSFHPERSPDLLPQFEENLLPLRGTLATHGSPYPVDTWVPWWLRWPGIDPVTVTEPAATADVVPTLAALLDLEPLAMASGEVRLPPYPEPASPESPDVPEPAGSATASTPSTRDSG